MICNDCKEQPASIHLTQMINGQKVEFHLCFACANRRNIQIWPILVPQGSAFKATFLLSQASGYEERVCSFCRLTWREFLATSFLGCTKCYHSFADLLGQLVAKNHGQTRHQGKIPIKGAGPMRVQREIIFLRNELEKAVTQENFEKAAHLRDQIHALEKTGKSS